MKTYLREVLDKIGLTLGEYGERITVFGFCGLVLEGHKGLCDYCEDHIIVKLKKRTLCVRGTDLKVREVSRDELFISGKIRGWEVNDDRQSNV